jgi:hypothetical protein
VWAGPHTDVVGRTRADTRDLATPFGSQGLTTRPCRCFRRARLDPLLNRAVAAAGVLATEVHASVSIVLPSSHCSPVSMHRSREGSANCHRTPRGRAAAGRRPSGRDGCTGVSDRGSWAGLMCGAGCWPALHRSEAAVRVQVIWSPGTLSSFRRALRTSQVMLLIGGGAAAHRRRRR